MTNDKLLTVAIHTFDKAKELKSILEHEGITVVLHNVNLTQPNLSSGVRVRIKEQDLPLALRIIENSEIFILPKDSATNTTQPTILVPVDFSSYSMKACSLAFDIATRHNGRIVLLHAYVPQTRINLQLTPVLDFTSPDEDPIEQGQDALDDEMSKAAKKRLDDFSLTLKEQIKGGQLPPVVFTTRTVASVPEDAILELAKDIKPYIIVMGTRGADKKERELIGSVTAEVLDSCRQPVFTIPEQSRLRTLDDLRDVILVSNLDQNDLLALDTLYRLAPNLTMNVHIVHIAGKRSRGTANQLELDMMLEYCRTHYPLCNFTICSLDTDHGIDYLKSLDNDGKTSLIVIPNKRKNILARLFNPSLATNYYSMPMYR